MKLVFKYVLQFEVSNLCFSIHSYISVQKEKKEIKKRFGVVPRILSANQGWVPSFLHVC